MPFFSWNSQALRTLFPDTNGVFSCSAWSSKFEFVLGSVYCSVRSVPARAGAGVQTPAAIASSNQQLGTSGERGTGTGRARKSSELRRGLPGVRQRDASVACHSMVYCPLLRRLPFSQSLIRSRTPREAIPVPHHTRGPLRERARGASMQIHESPWDLQACREGSWKSEGSHRL